MVIIGCGKKSQNDEILNDAQARIIIASYLEDATFDRTVRADVYDMPKTKVDVLGRYGRKWIAVRYGEEYLEMGAPQISPDIDYRLDIPVGNKEFIQAVMQLLKKAKFSPVLSKSKKLGVVKPFTNIKGLFEVRHAKEGECRIVDLYLNCAGVYDIGPGSGTKPHRPFISKFDIEGGEYCASTFSLRNMGGYLFQMPLNKGFALKEGNYTVLCDFISKNGLKSEDVETAFFDVAHSQGPVYKGGFRDALCEQGDEVKLNAVFVDEEGNEVEPEYYDEFGNKMDSNEFDCFSVGVYTVKAIAIDKHGVRSESREAKVYVYNSEEQLFPGMENIPGRPARVEIVE